jgi:hypothetical protein
MSDFPSLPGTRLLMVTPANFADWLGYVGPSDWLGLWYNGDDLIVSDGIVTTNGVPFYGWSVVYQAPANQTLLRSYNLQVDGFNPHMLLLKVENGEMYATTHEKGLAWLQYRMKNQPHPAIDLSEEDLNSPKILNMLSQTVADRFAPISPAISIAIQQWYQQLSGSGLDPVHRTRHRDKSKHG